MKELTEAQVEPRTQSRTEKVINAVAGATIHAYMWQVDKARKAIDTLANKRDDLIIAGCHKMDELEKKL